MEYNINKKDIEEGKENLIHIDEFSLKYPSLYTLSISEGNIIKYIDSSKDEYLIGMNLNGSISLFLDIDRFLLQNLEEDALIELHRTKLKVNKIIDSIA